MESVRDRTKIENSMACLLRGLVGKRTTIELRNEDSINAVIDHVDSNMNVDLSDATCTSLRQDPREFDRLYVHGKNIRFVHIPDEVSIIETIKEQIGVFRGRGKFRDKMEKKRVLTKEEKKQRTKMKIDERVRLMKENLGLLNIEEKKEKTS